MVENAKRPGRSSKKGGYAVRRSADTGVFTTHFVTSLEPAPRSRKRPPVQEKAPDPNDGSTYLQELRRLGGMADRGETLDATGMSKAEFLKSFLGH